MEQQPVKTVNISKFPYRVCVAKTRKPKYKNGKCTNKNLLNKPRFKTINTQKMYSGYSSPHERTHIVNAIKDDFRPKIQSQVSQELPTPLKIRMTVYDVESNFDLDNRAWIYFKCFQDLIVSEGIIPDDSIYYVRGNEYLFQPVATEEERAFQFDFFQL